jgi:hypothetical protein
MSTVPVRLQQLRRRREAWRQRRELVERLLRERPMHTYTAISEIVGLSRQQIYNIALEIGETRREERKNYSVSLAEKYSEQTQAFAASLSA